MYWKPFRLNGKDFDLSHLHPRSMFFTQAVKGDNPERVYEVSVIFSMHCFTEFPSGTRLDPSFAYSDNRETRHFNLRRYELSFHLPRIIEDLMQCRCFHTGRDNFFTFKLIDENGAQVDYEIFFSVSKSERGALNLYVQSAYVRDYLHSNRPHEKPIRFAVILFNTLNNRPIKVPT